MASTENKFVSYTLLVQYLIYMHHALGLCACKSDTAHTGM